MDLAEFNVFGNGVGTQAAFNIGSSISVRTSIDDGTTNAPTCVNESETAETNNLTLVGSCAAVGGASPSIAFAESFLGPAAALQPLFVSDFHNQQHFAYLVANGQVWDAYSCPDCDDAPWRLQQINGAGGLTSGPPAVSGPLSAFTQPPISSISLIWPPMAQSSTPFIARNAAAANGGSSRSTLAAAA